MTEHIGWCQEQEDTLTNLYQLLQLDSVVMDRLGPPTSQLKENQRKPVDWERKKGY